MPEPELVPYLFRSFALQFAQTWLATALAAWPWTPW